MNRKTETRIERDALGEIEIPPGAYWGINTARVLDVLNSVFTNSPYSHPLPLPHPGLIDAILLVKKSAALTNGETGRLDGTLSRIIAQAADEALSGQWRDQFVIDPFYTGSIGTLNDNVNEVLSNRAAEILGGTIGTYELIDPENHVNLGQSANDVFPTAMRIAILLLLKELEPVLLDTERLLRRKSLELDKVVKTGRAYLQDTAPVTLGQEFNAYGSIIERCLRHIKDASLSLIELNIGATHVGTGLNVDSDYVLKMVEKLSQFTGLKLRPADDFFRLTQSMGDFVHFSSSLKELSLELIKISNDLRLLGSGPQAGLGEINLPTWYVEPSAILPGALPSKKTPVLIESLAMTSFQVVGNDNTVSLAAQAGQLELNTMMPLIINNMLSSLDLLRNSILAFNQRCLTGLSSNPERCRKLLEKTRLMAPLLATHLGTECTITLVQESVSSDKPLREMLVEQDLLTQEVFDKLMQQKPLTQPGVHKCTANDTVSR